MDQVWVLWNHTIVNVTIIIKKLYSILSVKLQSMLGVYPMKNALGFVVFIWVTLSFPPGP